MTHIAFLGLGRMGAAMATRLLGAGHQLNVWNRSPAAADALVAHGATTADTPAAAVRGAPLVVTMLSDADAVRDVVGSALPGFAASALLVEMSTIGPAAVVELRRRLPESVRLVDGPVRGSIPAVRAGELEIYLGGDERDIADCREPLHALGTVRHVGPLGSAAALKLVLNAAGMSSIVLLGDVLQLADRLGVPAETALSELAGVMPAAARVRRRMDQPDPPTHFTVALARKDLALALAGAASRATEDLTVTDDAVTDDAVTDGVVAAAYRGLSAAAAAGQGDHDITSIIEFLRGTR